MGFDVLLLCYICVKRNGAQHAVVHADGGRVCDGMLHVGGWGWGVGGTGAGAVEEPGQGSALTGIDAAG